MIFSQVSWQGEPKRGALADGAFGPDSTAMTLDYSLDVRQPDTIAFEFVLRMQPLEDSEKLVGLLHVESRAVVANKGDHFVVLGRSPDLNF